MNNTCAPVLSSAVPVSSTEVHLRRSKNNIPKARMRTLKMSIVIVLSFIVCWTPYYLLGLWYWFFPDDLEGKVSHSLTHILFIFGLFNACLDPVIYGLFTVHFRKGLLKRYYRRNMAPASDHENSTVITGPFRGISHAFPLKRQPSVAARDRSTPAQADTKSPRSDRLTVGGGGAAEGREAGTPSPEST